MDKEKRTEILVGIVTFVGLLILVFGILWGKGASIFQNKQNMTVYFKDVRGLETGDLVVIRGMAKGRVVDVVLQKETVKVQLEIHSDVQLFDDLSIEVQSKELMGGKQVSIHPGQSGVPADLSIPFYGDVSGDPIALFSQVSKLASQVESILDQLKPTELQTQLLTLMSQLESAAKESQLAIKENKTAVQETVLSLKATVTELEKDSTVAKVGNLVEALDSTTQKMNRLIALAEKGEGTFGLLLQDPDLYYNMKSTTASLDSLVQDVKENPKRYIHVSVF